jgi:hypothetical protein
MTPSQLERAARHYCKLMGLDPDEWRLRHFSDVLKSNWAMNEALKEGMRDQKVDEVVSALFPVGRGQRVSDTTETLRS